MFVKTVTDDIQAVAKIQGDDTHPQGRVEDQDKSSYFSASSHHSLRRNTNWDCSKQTATVSCWLQGLLGWLSVCSTARGRGLTVLLHRQGRLRIASAHNPTVPDFEHTSTAKLIKAGGHYSGKKRSSRKIEVCVVLVCWNGHKFSDKLTKKRSVSFSWTQYLDQCWVKLPVKGAVVMIIIWFSPILHEKWLYYTLTIFYQYWPETQANLCMFPRVSSITQKWKLISHIKLIFPFYSILMKQIWF